LINWRRGAKGWNPSDSRRGGAWYRRFWRRWLYPYETILWPREHKLAAIKYCQKTWVKKKDDRFERISVRKAARNLTISRKMPRSWVVNKKLIKKLPLNKYGGRNDIIKVIRPRSYKKVVPCNNTFGNGLINRAGLIVGMGLVCQFIRYQVLY
jgi:hypothetical protein